MGAVKKNRACTNCIFIPLRLTHFYGRSLEIIQKYMHILYINHCSWSQCFSSCYGFASLVGIFHVNCCVTLYLIVCDICFSLYIIALIHCNTFLQGLSIIIDFPLYLRHFTLRKRDKPVGVHMLEANRNVSIFTLKCGSV